MARCMITGRKIGKRMIVTPEIWDGLDATRKTAIRAWYSRDEKGQKFLTLLLTVDILAVKAMVKDGEISPAGLARALSEQEGERAAAKAAGTVQREVEVIHKRTTADS